jgi:hypothetical protein
MPQKGYSKSLPLGVGRNGRIEFPDELNQAALIGGETACATETGAVFFGVGQTVSSAAPC